MTFLSATGLRTELFLLAHAYLMASFCELSFLCISCHMSSDEDSGIFLQPI